MYYSRNISLSELSNEVAGITGKDVVVVYGEHYTTSLDPNDPERFIITIPQGTYRISPDVRHGVVHEAMHVKYTDCFDNDGIATIMRGAGFHSDDEQHVIFDFLNAFEDIRIQAKGEKEYLGARFIFQEGRDYISKDIYSKMWEQYNATSGHARQLLMARVFLLLNIDLLPGYADWPSSGRQTYGWEARYINDAVNAMQSNWWENTLLPSLKVKGITAFSKRFTDELRDTATSADGFQLASKYFLKRYCELLPPNLAKALEPQKIEAFIKALAKAIANGQLMKGSGQGGSPLGMVKVLCGSADEKGQKDLGKELSEHAWGSGPSDGGREDITERLGVIANVANSVFRRLADVLRDIKEWKESGGERLNIKKGKLDALQIHRVALDECNVYKKDINPDYEEDVAFSVVIDTSGSMYQDPKNYDRLNCALGLASGLSQALEIIERPVSLVDFSNHACERVKVGQKMTNDSLGQAIAEGGGGTSLLAGVTEAVKGLDKAQEKTKVMFVITDGDINPAELTEVKAKCEKSKIRPFFIIIHDDRSYFDSVFDKFWGDRNVLKEYISDGNVMEIVPIITKFVHALLTKQV